VTPPPPATTASYRHDEVTDSGAYSAVHVAEPAVHVIRASKVERSIERERERTATENVAVLAVHVIRVSEVERSIERENKRDL
jgi:hypothetical protein